MSAGDPDEEISPRLPQQKPNRTAYTESTVGNSGQTGAHCRTGQLLVSSGRPRAPLQRGHNAKGSSAVPALTANEGTAYNTLIFKWAIMAVPRLYQDSLSVHLEKYL